MDLVEYGACFLSENLMNQSWRAWDPQQKVGLLYHSVVGSIPSDLGSSSSNLACSPSYFCILALRNTLAIFSPLWLRRPSSQLLCRKFCAAPLPSCDAFSRSPPTCRAENSGAILGTLENMGKTSVSGYKASNQAKRKSRPTWLSWVADLAPRPQLNACSYSQCSMQIVFSVLWLHDWEKEPLRRPGLPISSVFFWLFRTWNILIKIQGVAHCPKPPCGWWLNPSKRRTGAQSPSRLARLCLEVCWRRFSFNVGHSWAKNPDKPVGLWDFPWRFWPPPIFFCTFNFGRGSSGKIDHIKLWTVWTKLPTITPLKRTI